MKKKTQTNIVQFLSIVTWLSFPAFGKKGGSFKIVIFPVQYSILYTDPDSMENIFRKLLNWGDSKNSIYCNVLPFLAEPSCILTLYYL